MRIIFPSHVSTLNYSICWSNFSLPIDNNKLPITLTLRDVIKLCLGHRREFLFLNVLVYNRLDVVKSHFLSYLNNFLMNCENIQTFNTSASSANDYVLNFNFLSKYKVFHR